MRGLLRNLGRKAALGAQFLESAWGCRARRHDFDGVQAFCLFLGYPRSGHSLVGSLMDAHPQMVFAHEANALKAIRYGFRRTQLFYWLACRSRRFSEAGRSYTGYSYEVPGQWQGRYRDLRVIGDKFGDFTVESFRRRPGLLARVRALVGVPVRFVHVVRNPFDNIATIALREGRSLESAAEFYFHLAANVMRFTAGLAPGEVLEVRHEALIASPRETIRSWCAFFGLEAPPDYVEACAGIVFPSPHRSRMEVTWPAGLVEAVGRRSEEYPFLAGYAFAEPGGGA